MSQTPKDLEVTPRPGEATVGNALWRSAVEAFGKAILVVVMGNVALGILGGIFSEMMPSSPLVCDKTPQLSEKKRSWLWGEAEGLANYASTCCYR